MWLMYQNTENLIHKEVPKQQLVSVHKYAPRNILKIKGLNVIIGEFTVDCGPTFTESITCVCRDI